MEKDHNGETFWGRQLFERYAPVQIHPQGGVYIPKHFFLLFIVAYNGYGRVCLLAVVFFFWSSRYREAGVEDFWD